MRHLFSTRLRVIIIVALVLSVALTIVSGAVNQSIPSLLVQGMLAPLKAGANAMTEQAEKFYGYMFRYESLAAENEALKAKIADMEDEARQADSYQRENQRLRKLLDLTSTHEDYKLVDAYVIAWSSTDWSSTVTVNKGTEAGIQLDMCAITANGEVVGLVTEVGKNFAVVKTVLDSSLEISATIASSGYRGMVKGGYTDGRKDLLYMDYLPSSAIIRNNGSYRGRGLRRNRRCQVCNSGACGGPGSPGAAVHSDRLHHGGHRRQQFCCCDHPDRPRKCGLNYGQTKKKSL